MTPEVRAAADRFIYEQATLKHLMALVPEGGFDRAVPGMDWTVRQVFAHLAASLGTYAATIRSWLEGKNPLEGWDPEHTNAETAAAYANRPATEIVTLFGSGLNELVAVLRAVPDEPPAFGPRDFADVLPVLSGHALAHAVPLMNAVPEARMDALILNWLLHAEFDDDERRAWQRELLAEARDYVASREDAAEEDGDEA